jgi:hypothetical protein
MMMMMMMMIIIIIIIETLRFLPGTTKLVSHEGKVAISCNEKVQTDRAIPNNKPDIIIRDYKKGTCMLIDVAITGGRNVIKKEAKKI